MTTVPNRFPTINGQPYRLALIGEAPGEKEVEAGRPFVGPSGDFLNGMLSAAGILRDACFVGNVCQIRPPGNNINLFPWDGPEITEGIKQLADDLYTFQPNLCILLGSTPLRMAKGRKESIEDWRGSLFQGHVKGDNHIISCKCLPTMHPAACLREYSYTPLLRFDLKKAAEEGRSPVLTLPERSLLWDLPIDEQIHRLAAIKLGDVISPDVEGYWNKLKMCSIATSSISSFLVNLQPNDADIIQERELWRVFANVIGNPEIFKVCQNAMYELFVLEYGYRIPLRGLIDDIMLKHWEYLCELPKALAFQASIYTREPFWKSETMYQTDRAALGEGCCRDSAVTYEINDVLSKHVKREGNYLLNLNLLQPLLYMEMKGIRYDKEKAPAKLKEVKHNEFRLQWALDQISQGDRPSTVEAWTDICKEAFVFQREKASVLSFKDIPSHSKTTCLDRAIRACQILEKPLTLSSIGELSVITKTNLNVDSKTQLPHFLYEVLKLPVQYKKEKGRLTDKVTTDVLALLTLYKKTDDPVLKLILTIRALKTRTETLGCKLDPDNRIRCSYNIFRDEENKGGPTTTGRLSCSTSLTGSGYSLHTTTKKDRDLFLPDTSDDWFFQCDLEGADGWTVAAHCAALGDPTMLEDYRARLKPARIMSLVAMHGRQVLSWSRDKLREESRTVDSDGWMYFARKRVQHGSNYGMKGQTMSAQILKDSYKLFGEPVFLSPADCELEQSIYFTRYPGILIWHEKIKQQLKKHGFIVSANGHRRVFFGRRDDYNTFKEACAEEPQNNTTYVTNLAIWKLWSDGENIKDDNSQDDQTRMAGLSNPDNLGPVPGTGIRLNPPPAEAGSSVQTHRLLTSLEKGDRLIVRPRHQIHDAIIGQFPKTHVEFARRKLREWFNNPITVAGITITIPFDGAYGRSWGELKEGTL